MPSRTKPLVGLTCRIDEKNEGYFLSADYSRAVEAAGGVPVQLPLIPSLAAGLVARLDAIVLTGSPSDVDPARYAQTRHPAVTAIHADRDETDFGLLDEAFRQKKPVLGICFGVQSLNVYLGGTLIQHIPDAVPGALEHSDTAAHHPVLLDPGSQLAAWAHGESETMVNSTHHQAVERLGRQLRVAARAPDGIIEAVEGDFPDHFVIGVQWHPERIWREEPVSRRLFSELISAAERHMDINTASSRRPSPLVQSV